jgi:urocanate hydratase
VARRAWARNENAVATGIDFNAGHQGTGHITLPFLADDEAVAKLVDEALDDVHS